MRRPAAALSLALTALVLAGCSDADGADPTPSASASESAEASADTAADAAALSSVTAEGALGAAPTLTFDQPFTITAPVARVDLEGDGEPITMTDVVLINYVVVSGDDGSVLGSTWDSGAPEALPLNDAQLVSGLKDVIIGRGVGTRVLFAVPGAEATDTSEAYPAQLLAVEITEKLPTRAQGEAVAPVAGLPTVTLAENGEPSVEIPAGTDATSTLVAQTLVQGTGPAVESGQTVTFQYSGWLTDGTRFDSSWAKGAPFQTQIGVGSVIDGWDQGLVGQTVGSQVLLVIPAELGYGAAGSGETIPANATLVFVVDILYAS